MNLIMTGLFMKKSLVKNIKELGPALAILLAALVISTFITEFTFTFGFNGIWKTFFRFLRLSALLCLPILFLPRICSFMAGILNRRTRQLLQVQEERDIAIRPLKSWILRPLQGIGLSMLIATKLLTVLQIYTQSRITVDTVLPPGQFNPGRFFTATAIAILVSLLLSFLWTLDDLGVRHYNKKTHEVKMIGKYIGLILPIFFGFYGIITLFDENSRLMAVQYIAQMVIVLYPPFVVFNVFHARYLANREENLLRRLRAATGVILTDRKEAAIAKA
jgi:hypothetical protein